MNPVIHRIHTLTRTFQLEDHDSLSILAALRASIEAEDPDSEQAGSYVFEAEFDGRRVVIIGAAPLYVASIYRDHSVLTGPRAGTSASSRVKTELLRAVLAAYTTPLAGLAGLAQSLFTVVGYDAARQFEAKLGQAVRTPMPDIWAMVPRTAVAIDLESGETVIVCNGVESSPLARELDTLERTIVDAAAATPLPTPASTPAPPVTARAQTSRAQFCAAAARAREYIRAGDIFQVVLSVEVVVEVGCSPGILFRRMSARNRGTANFLIEAPEFALVGASPEVLVEKRGHECVIRPLAGTLAHQGRRDEQLEARLLGDEKECAEHRMLVDLARNDLGRVCEYGSVIPGRLMEVEYYYNVMHIASEVHGVVRRECDAIDLLTRSFPAGTMTGAPKIRAMQIIDELEHGPRAFYAGGVGFLTPSGDLRSHILIRSLTLHDGLAYARAGAGIVYNSDPDREYDECLVKLQNAWSALTGEERVSP